MIKFIDEGTSVILTYSSDQSIDWVNQKLQKNGEVTLSRTFTVHKVDIFRDSPRRESWSDDDESQFVIGKIENGYRHIYAKCLGIKHDVLISIDIKLERKIFIAAHNVSIFHKIDELTDNQIIIGGDADGNIPVDIFNSLVKSFPTEAILYYYAQAQIGYLIQDFLELKTPAGQKLHNAIERIKAKQQNTTLSVTSNSKAITKFDITKLTYVRDKLTEMLNDTHAYDENEWEANVANLFLLLYPRYIKVLQQVTIPDSIAPDETPTRRRIDLLLVDADGYIDVIEIKKPHDNAILRKGTYRDNFIPALELEGVVMQIEKYLHHLNRWGKSGEKVLQKRFHNDLPDDLLLHVTHPKGIILAGRSNDLKSKQLTDFEVIRRRYSDIMDIITYDMFLRRINNIIAALEKD